MPFTDAYRDQVALLIRILPFVAEEDSFALKGGTAINLFHRNMPRLSVDIDLTYLTISPREESLADIDAAIKRIAQRIREALPKGRVDEGAIKPENTVTKLLVRERRAQVKIEVTPVLRGCVYSPEIRQVSPAVEDAFGFAEMRVVSFADLYAGKIVAALDRQHPRDLFDVRALLANEGIDEALRRAFIVYVLSHERPIAELLAPTRKPLANEFSRGFAGMIAEPVTIEELESVREALIGNIVGKMPKLHRRFLLSFKRGDPEWALLDILGAKDLPAVRWKQANLDKLSAEARRAAVAKLDSILLAGGDLAGLAGA